MPRANTQTQLLEYGEAEFARLNQLVDRFSPEEQASLEVFENRSIKDLLAHLDDWLQLVFNWEDAVKAGEKPQIPAPGYTWKDTPAFNEMLYQKSKNRSLMEVRQSLKAHHQEAMRRVGQYIPEEIESKALFKWTGSSSVASYYASCTSSHYVWAAGLLKKLFKDQKA